MTGFRGRLKVFITVILLISFTVIKGCNGSNSIDKAGVSNSSLAVDKASDKDASASDGATSEDDEEALSVNESYDKLKELIKEGISKRTETVIEFSGVRYLITEVYGGDISGERKAKVAVDIGFGDREYWAFTNEYGQLVYVYAEKIIPQDEENESVTKDGRYYADEAKVAGTERKDLDEGHVIADSLGGVANAYNITPQNSSLNRYGNQAYMEKVIRDAGGCEEFIAVITYNDTSSQIPVHYHYEYILFGEKITDDFDNIDPDEANNPSSTADETNMNSEYDISAIDKNGDGKVTIAEAKAAGFKMPIYSDHWLYQYMTDRDGDGMVGE